ncbi:MAG: hypothetical protein HN580_25310 [Deltaproteobacteria bacterium]|jgi:hypothetical protein|nr:hypothetical protein [Deltaproteobacteria bacterium]MBT4090740.1 hypothetical protein [Deltaproteobacteria bacterium]MBT4269280.1 hypothetical protein [Deltaproteobacteria bacterium]MBT4639205.1 hypothetical protein [Deltaproteobacteria bacterium]MBT6498567.1 hypothetical protein [Deltaproteobacteria bacterium]
MNVEQILVDVISETVETMAFMEVLKKDTITPYDEHLERLRVEILVNAPFPGEIRLVLPKSLAVLFSQNMYSLDEQDVTIETVEDVLGEIVNIIAGRLMADILPEDQTFQLGLPLIGPDAFLETEASSHAIEFYAEETPFWVVLFGEGFQSSP